MGDTGCFMLPRTWYQAAKLSSWWSTSPLRPVPLHWLTPQSELFGSAYASAVYMKKVLNFPEDKRVYVLGEKGLEDELDAVGIKHCGGTVSNLVAQLKSDAG